MKLNYAAIKAAYKVALTDSMIAVDLGTIWRHQVVFLVNCNSLKSRSNKRYYGFKKGCYLQLNILKHDFESIARYGGNLTLDATSYRSLIKSIKHLITNYISIKREDYNYLTAPLKEDVEYLLSKLP